jgi:ABC-type transporter Mla MlaB component
MFTIAGRSEAPEAVRLTLAGKMSANALRELRREIEEALRRRKPIVLDMSEVTLVDKPSIDFLTSQPDSIVQFENCPPYLQRWISRAAAAD